jgi:glyoxylase-like metal-dependent hydrolase (beta-lactamase superfamily II)
VNRPSRESKLALTERDQRPDIEEVGDHIFRLPLPIPFEVGPVNCYLIRRDEPVLIDTGPRIDRCWDALLAHLATLGFALADLRHVIVTHAHVDHYGNLKKILDAAPLAKVHAHEADAHGIFEHDDNMRAKVEEIGKLLRFWGYPGTMIEPTLRGYMSWRKYAETVARDRYQPITGETDDLVLGGETRLRAIHTPGHSEGLICLHLEEGQGALFAADHILEHITPNPTVYIPPFRGRRSGLGDYIDSLARVRDLRAARILPGHDPAFGGLAARVDEILAHHEDRKRRIAAIVSGEPLTVLDIVSRVWTDLSPDSWYLACREVQGHLDLLIADQLATESLEPMGLARFQARA